MTKPMATAETSVTKKLRKLFEIGDKSLRRRSGTGAYGKGMIDEEAKRRGINPDILRKLRAFASPGVGYSRSEFDALCRECEKHDREWGIRHVALMLRVPKQGGQRAQIQREAIEEGWGVSRFEAEVRKRVGRRTSGGRRRAVPEDVAGLLSQIELFCEQWRRWHSDAQGQDPRKGRLAGLPPTVREKIHSADEAIDALQAAVAPRLERERRKN